MLWKPWPACKLHIQRKGKKNIIECSQLSSSSSSSFKGYSPLLEEMQASFLAYGPNIKKNYNIGTVRDRDSVSDDDCHNYCSNIYILSKIHITDIGPTIAHIMNISLPDAEGRVLHEIFA